MGIAVDVSDVHANDWNPNEMEDWLFEKERSSIRRFGFVDPITVRETPDGPTPFEVVDGEHRWRAAQLEGITRLPAWNLGVCSRHEAMALTEVMNNLRGKHNDEGKRALISELIQADPSYVHVLPYHSEHINEIVDNWSNDDLPGGGSEVVAQEEPAQVEPPKVPVTRPGDLWILGDHRLSCGDCKDASVVAALAGGRKVSVAVTSPPYASQRKYDESTKFKPIHPDEYVDWFFGVQRAVAGVLSDDGSWFVNIKAHAEDRQRSLYVYDLVSAHVREWGWRFVDDLCWLRIGMPGKYYGRFKNGWEPVFHFSRSREIKFNPSAVSHDSDAVPKYRSRKERPVDTFAHYGDERSYDLHAHDEVFDGKALPSNVLPVFQAVEAGVSHPAMFPVGLPSFFIKAFSDSGDLVFDPFMGSGTTLLASEMNGRECIGTELSPAYCDVIVERWQNLTGGKATRSK